MFVAFAYKLTDADNGEILFEVGTNAPDTMVYGVTEEIVPGLIAAMKDLKAGDKFAVTLPPEAAFGPRHEENVMQLEKEIFIRDGELVDEVKEGATIPMMTQEGFRVLGTVLGIGDSHIKMDFNHPFAGRKVKYEGEVVDVRPATEDELKPMSCGCGCGSGCGDGDCGEGCGASCGCH